MRKTHDRIFLGTVLILIVFGFFIFVSASFGLLTRTGANFTNVVLKQFLVGVVLGIVALILANKIQYKLWRKWSPHLFLLSIVVCLLVFVPHVGVISGGARRWIALGPISFQPGELLKLACVLALASWYSRYPTRVDTVRYGLLPFSAVVCIAAILLLKQPDTGTFLVLASALFGLYMAAGAEWKHCLGVIIFAGIGLFTLAHFTPYVNGRLQTFLHPNRDSLGASYQLRQSLIAVGSGRLSGRGFGQSIQKFNYLPQAIGDSIFAVAAEEFGFIGSVILLLIFLALGLRGMKIAQKAPDAFSRLVTVGLVILMVAQSLINIGAMIGVIPLTGVPLLFVSQGGTALFFALVEVGIILNISKYRIE